MRSFATILAGGVAILASVNSASAQELIDATDPERVASIVRGFGSARIGVAGDDTPMISGRIEGTPFSVYFYECDDDDVNCRSVSFSANWSVDTVDMEEINDWNAKSRFGRVYLDDDGEPYLEMDVNMFGSVTEANFEDWTDWWRVVLADFAGNVVEASEGGGNDDGDDNSDDGNSDDGNSGGNDSDDDSGGRSNDDSNGGIEPGAFRL